ncbi:MAG: hypothetical protein WCH83_08745, partial [Alphaproteobacteria bacterium]
MNETTPETTPRSTPERTPVATPTAGGSAASPGAGEGMQLLIERPDPGQVRVHDVAGFRSIKFAFPIDTAKVVVLDVDVVLVFPDGAKILLPGLALQIVTDAPPDLTFQDIQINPQAFVAKIGEVKLADSLPSMSLASAEAAAPPEEKKPPPEAEERPPPPPPATPRPQIDAIDQGKTDKEAETSNTSNAKSKIIEEGSPPSSSGA